VSFADFEVFAVLRDGVVTLHLLDSATPRVTLAA
jgi:hypothetical protein